MIFIECTFCLHTILPREEINSQLDWLYTNNVCAYPVLQGGATAKVRGTILRKHSFLLELSMKGVNHNSKALGYFSFSLIFI